MFYKISTREIKKKFKRKHLENNMPLQFFHSIFLFKDISFQKWNDKARGVGGRWSLGRWVSGTPNGWLVVGFRWSMGQWSRCRWVGGRWFCNMSVLKWSHLFSIFLFFFRAPNLYLKVDICRNNELLFQTQIIIY